VGDPEETLEFCAQYNIKSTWTFVQEVPLPFMFLRSQKH
jgi:hypothetical protein